MATIFYQNLGVPRPENLLKSAYYGLGDIYKVLSTTQKYLESPETVMRLGWEELRKKHPEGYWVHLIAPPDDPDVEEIVYARFLDDDSTTLYQWDTESLLDFRDADPVRVLNRDADEEALLLDRLPSKRQLVLRPNAYALLRQQQALKALQDCPAKEHLPLLQLLEGRGFAQWGVFERVRVERWWWLGEAEESTPTPREFSRWQPPTSRTVLRPGTEEQRRFVEIALATTDFAFLEGPPGSGKTTAICELIRQLVDQGKRILLCASTHVAVDNVLERLMAQLTNNPVIPVRIGDRGKISDGAEAWQLEVFREREKERLTKFLQANSPPPGSARATLLQALKGSDETVTRLILDSANLVCGTTLGILQHPDIKGRQNRGSTPQFDVMILDEASKTTFAEFLVPALHAKRWVIVGDTKQLSPYVDEDAIAANLQACLSDASVRNACVDLVQAEKLPILIISGDESERQAYRLEGEARGLIVADAEQREDAALLPAAHVVLATPESANAAQDSLPLDLCRYRGPKGFVDESLERRMVARRTGKDRNNSVRAEGNEWSEEVAWRSIRGWEQRLRPSAKSKHHEEKVRSLLPKAEAHEPEEVEEGIQRVRRIVLPSVLECLQRGFERSRRQLEIGRGNALTDGMPSYVFSARHVLLKYQHRMHPDISAFSRDNIYDGVALLDPQDIAAQRDWSYPGPRAIWIDVKGESTGRSSVNQAEARRLIEELKRFHTWAECNPRADGKPWEVAVLTFYRGQEKELRKHIRNLTSQHVQVRHFHLGSSQKPTVSIQLCTVDRFQGQEADVVLLSFAKTHATDFLESPNRLNVALTRARYLRLCFGDRHGLLGKTKSRRDQSEDDSLLARFVGTSKAQFDYGVGQ